MNDPDPHEDFSFTSVDYDEDLFAVYDRGQSMPTRALLEWIRRFTMYIDARARPLTILDLGSGTGRLSLAMAEAGFGTINGVEPSTRMREIACKFRQHPKISYRPGSAEGIPVPDSTSDVVLLFRVMQHVTDPWAAGAEIARVLRPKGRILICGEWAGRPYPRPWAKYFPRANLIAELGLPTIDGTIDLLRRFGMEFVAIDRHSEEIAESLQAYFSRLQHRAISAMRYLTEEEIEAGLAALRADVAAQGAPGPVWYESEMLVMEKTS